MTPSLAAPVRLTGSPTLGCQPEPGVAPCQGASLRSLPVWHRLWTLGFPSKLLRHHVLKGLLGSSALPRAQEGLAAGEEAVGGWGIQEGNFSRKGPKVPQASIGVVVGASS